MTIEQIDKLYISSEEATARGMEDHAGPYNARLEGDMMQNCFEDFRLRPERQFALVKVPPPAGRQYDQEATTMIVATHRRHMLLFRNCRWDKDGDEDVMEQFKSIHPREGDWEAALKLARDAGLITAQQMQASIKRYLEDKPA